MEKQYKGNFRDLIGEDVEWADWVRFEPLEEGGWRMVAVDGERPKTGNWTAASNLKAAPGFWKERGKKGPVEPEFRPGQKVDFVNDYGVLFEGRVVTGVTVWDSGEIRYYTAPSEAYWFPVGAHNLCEPGTYAQDFDLDLNGGDVARFVRFGDWGEKIYAIEAGGRKISAILTDGALHTLNDWEEPVSPLPDDLQPADPEKTRRMCAGGAA